MKQTAENAIGMPCPHCGANGHPVKTHTLRAMLKPEQAPKVKEETCFFCGAAACEVVYFAAAGELFRKTDLAVRVGSKESVPPRPLCYWFGHTMESIAAEIERTGGSTAMADIRRRIREEGCACETKNPAGRCCLGTVEQFVREQLASSGQAAGVGKTQAGGGC